VAEEGEGDDELVTVCTVCKKMLKDGQWVVREDLRLRPNQKITHAFCPDCGKKLYPGYAEPRDED